MSKLIAVLVMVLIVAMMCVGCSHQTTSNTARVHTEHKHEHGHGHKAVHGGSLNAIVTCENGHAEVVLDGNTLQLWFVGGGPNTDKSVRVPDKSISVQVKADNSAKTLVLTAKPLDLAGENVGDCSHFEGSAPWLKGLAQFTADGQITFKGKKVPLRIE